MIVKADLDEIVFRTRNKEYGAYILRKMSPRYTRNAFIIGIAVLLLMFSAPYLINQIDFSGGNVEEEASAEAVLTEPPPIDEKQEQPEEIEEPPPPPPKRDEVRFVPPEIVPDEQAPPEQTIANIEKLDSAQVSTQTVEGDANAPENIEIVPEAVKKPVELKPEPEEDKDPAWDEFVYVEKNPEPVNLDDIKKNIKYPQIAKEGGIQGKVLIKILVDKEGNPKDFKVLRSPHQLLTDACMKEVKNLKFKPGIQAKKPIKVWVVIPFDFKIN